MKKHPLHEDRKAALIQWNAAHTLINSLESQLSIERNKVLYLDAKLKAVDVVFLQAEIDALYEENERLTNIIEAVDKK